MTCGLEALGQMPAWQQQQPSFEVLAIADGKEVWVTEANLWQYAHSVTKVKLSNRELDEIPAIVFQLPNLKQLDLSRNTIGSVPRDILDMTQLEVLDLSKNGLVEFPFVPENLQQLYLKGNNIHNIPDQSESSLKIVDLVDNPIQDFDPSYFPEGAQVVRVL